MWLFVLGSSWGTPIFSQGSGKSECRGACGRDAWASTLGSAGYLRAHLCMQAPSGMTRSIQNHWERMARHHHTSTFFVRLGSSGVLGLSSPCQMGSALPCVWCLCVCAFVCACVCMCVGGLLGQSHFRCHACVWVFLGSHLGGPIAFAAARGHCVAKRYGHFDFIMGGCGARCAPIVASGCLVAHLRIEKLLPICSFCLLS